MTDFDELEALTANWTPAAKAKAIEQYRLWIETERHAWYCVRGRSCDGQPHENYPYKHARGDQYPPAGEEWLVWAMLSGRGCVAPETRIYDPSTGLHTPIADLCITPVNVDTFDGITETDGPAFLKGYDNLWRVTLSDGSKITVTAWHRFLTPAGWRPLHTLGTNDVIAGGGVRAEDTGVVNPLSKVPSIPGVSNGHKVHYRSGKAQGEDNFRYPVWQLIESITWERFGAFWDLTVPGAHHYSAEGIWNHNSGKTRTGSEWLRKISGRVGRMAMVGRRGVDVRATLVEGDSGLIKTCENAGIGFDWQPSKREFTFMNGAKVYGYSGEEPDSLRGPQHGALWVDEPAHMPLIQDVWDNALLGLRLPGLPGGAKALVTTTPLPTMWVKNLVKDPGTRVVRTSTYANLDNLDPAFRARILGKYEGTRLGRQELHGEILEDVVGALWHDYMLQVSDHEPADLERIVVGIDPAGSVNPKSDETGIVVAGKIGTEYHVLDDFSDKYSPNAWAERAIKAYQFYQADAIVAEKNYGGDMVRTTIENVAKHLGETVRVVVATAMRGKKLRAEPIVALYEQKRVYHQRGLQELETEMCGWVPGVGDSPNRVDALVWAMTELEHHGGWGGIGIPRGALPLRRGPKNPAGAEHPLNRSIFS